MTDTSLDDLLGITNVLPEDHLERWQYDNMNFIWTYVKDGPHPMLQIRGWGYFTGLGGIGPKLTAEQAVRAQSIVGHLAAAAPDLKRALELILEMDSVFSMKETARITLQELEKRNDP